MEWPSISQGSDPIRQMLNGNGPDYLADSLQRVTDVWSRRRLRSSWTSSSSSLIVPVTRRATLADRAFPVVDSPPGLGTAYQTTSRQRLPTHHSVLRWRRICFPGLSGTDNMRHWLCNVVLKRCCACTTLILQYDESQLCKTVCSTQSLHDVSFICLGYR